MAASVEKATSTPQSTPSDPTPLARTILDPASRPPLKPTHGIHVATLSLAAHHPYALDLFSRFAVQSARSLGIPTSNPANLPMTKELHTVLRGPFVHKKYQENFERRTHRRTIKVFDADKGVVDLWLRYLKRNGIGGVGMRARVYEWVEFGFGRQEVEGLERQFEGGEDLDAVERKAEELIKALSAPQGDEEEHEKVLQAAKQGDSGETTTKELEATTKAEPFASAESAPPTESPRDSSSGAASSPPTDASSADQLAAAQSSRSTAEASKGSVEQTSSESSPTSAEVSSSPDGLDASPAGSQAEAVGSEGSESSALTTSAESTSSDESTPAAEATASARSSGVTADATSLAEPDGMTPLSTPASAVAGNDAGSGRETSRSQDPSVTTNAAAAPSTPPAAQSSDASAKVGTETVEQSPTDEVKEPTQHAASTPSTSTSSPSTPSATSSQEDKASSVHPNSVKDAEATTGQTVAGLPETQEHVDHSDAVKEAATSPAAPPPAPARNDTMGGSEPLTDAIEGDGEDVRLGEETEGTTAAEATTPQSASPIEGSEVGEAKSEGESVEETDRGEVESALTESVPVEEVVKQPTGDGAKLPEEASADADKGEVK